MRWPMRGPPTAPRRSPGPGAGGFGVLDGLRRPKPGWWALVEACRPLVVVADQLPESVRAGDHLDLAVHVVNDTRADVPDMQVQARMLGPDGRVVREHRWAGTARADDCVLVGRLSAVVPAVAQPGRLTLERDPYRAWRPACPGNFQPLHSGGLLEGG